MSKKKTHTKVRQELYKDIDYFDKLSEEERNWLDKFNKEYIDADFRHSKRIHKKKIKVKKIASTGKKKKIDIGAKDCYDANNSRNSDTFSVTKANNLLEGEKSLVKASKTTKLDAYEDAIIECIDYVNKDDKD